MVQYSIRKISLADLESLIIISNKTFSETFADDNTEENLTEYLEKAFNEEKLASELQEKDSEFYFVEDHNEVLAYLKVNINQSQTEKVLEEALEIERIYVNKEFQGKKIGQLLLSKAIALAKKKHLNQVWLGVWEHNPKAIKFYKRNGFQEFDKHTFKLGDDEQIDILMKLTL
jgi:ribosomal protein S18 acetylase RimI-like enzyme